MTAEPTEDYEIRVVQGYPLCERCRLPVTAVHRCGILEPLFFDWAREAGILPSDPAQTEEAVQAWIGVREAEHARMQEQAAALTQAAQEARERARAYFLETYVTLKELRATEDP